MQIDTVLGLQDYAETDGRSPVQVVIDGFVSADLGRGWLASLRPRAWRAGGEWELLVDHASVQRTFRGRASWRVEAGRFVTPIGFGMTENRPNLNAGTIWCHRPYYMALPSLGADEPPVSLISAVYPNGALVAGSGQRWDVRAAAIDRAPVEFWKRDPRAARSMNVITGGGVTLRQGARVGVSAATGQFGRPVGDGSGSRYRLINVEGEIAAGHTKVSGEWTRTDFSQTDRDRRAHGVTLQAQRTFTPRVFAHSRASWVESPEHLASGDDVIRHFWSIDTTIGYRVTPEIALRASHAAVRGWAIPRFDHQLGASIMWTRRWW